MSATLVAPTTLNVDTLDRFRAWLGEPHGTIALKAVASGTNSRVPGFAVLALAVGAADGTAWLLDDHDTQTAQAALRAAAACGKPLWAHGATADAYAIETAYGLRMSRLRCSVVLAKSLMPDTIRKAGATDLDALRPEAKQHRGDAARLAVACARLVHAFAATTPEAARRIASQDTIVEDLWRWVSRRGFRVDVERLDREIAAVEQAIEVSIARWGINLLADSDATRRWVASRGILCADADGRPSLSHDHFPTAIVPTAAAADWEEFVALREGPGANANKLHELRSALDTHGRIYPTIHAIGATTGRQSITGPALQNLPASLRGLLLAEPGMVLVGCDLDRVEPRIVAGLSQDPALIEAVQKDVYTELAVAVWGEPARGDGVKRGRAKTAFLAMIYGQGTESLARSLRVTVDEARAILRGIHTGYPVLARWLRDTVRAAEAGVPQTTALGRPLPSARGQEYVMQNWRVQGSAADLFKGLTIGVADALGKSALWLPVHDELIVQVPESDAVEAAGALGEAMATEFLGVPITGSPAVLGSRWGKA